MAEIIPILDRLLVLKDKMPEKSHGGVWLPDNRKTPEDKYEMRLVTGEVLAVSDKVTDLRESDKVYFEWHAGWDLNINGYDCVMLPRDRVHARLLREEEVSHA